jgi:hypothetical protein
MNQTEPRLFISYRRYEAARHAGRLCEAISGRLGARNVFMDPRPLPGNRFR